MVKLTKFDRMLHYIIWRCGDKKNVGVEVLCKLCYFSDFDHYEKTCESITGHTYIRLSHGPVPLDYDGRLGVLADEGLVSSAKGSSYNHTQHRYTSLSCPDTSELSKVELETIDSAISRYSDMNGVDIEKISHADMPWRCAGDGSIIDYGLAMYRDARTSVDNTIYEDDGE
ncbi:MAG: SocA family protein [Candidatus Methanoplasma sp.]|jgi:hypothetical protein|nr:SocA family protein [Candidatus Methanoplasma sp.]